MIKIAPLMAETQPKPQTGSPENVKISTAKSDRKKDIPKGLWTKCDACSEIIYNKALEENLRICPKCDHHMTLGAYERVESLADAKTFEEMDEDVRSVDPIKFQGPKAYVDKLEEERARTGLRDAVVTGTAQMEGQKVMLAVTDSRFIMGSMGSVVGEKLTRAIETATEKRLPVIIVSGSGGGARMYEGALSLMQMAKTSAALARHHAASQLFISVLTNPTMAGIMASYASLGDLVVAEPRALIGFTGPRVIEQTIRQKLPDGFQTSEFLLEHGWLDQVIHRRDLKSRLAYFAAMLKKTPVTSRSAPRKKSR
jgi:acetyl-CoA carboxylase carboxyl transferase subunit beta